MWVKCEERTPADQGSYRVIRRGYGRKRREDRCMWNGGKWIGAAYSIVTTVEEWWEDEHE